MFFLFYSQNLWWQAWAVKHFQCRGTGFSQGCHPNMRLFHLQHSVLLHSLCRKIPGDQWGVGLWPQFLLRATHPVYLHSMPVIFPQRTKTNAHIHSVNKPNFLWVWDVLEYNHVKRMILRTTLASTKAVCLLYLANFLYIWVQKMCILPKCKYLFYNS